MLRESRKEAGLSQEELADLIGVAQQTVAKYETGERTPRLGKALKIVEILRSKKVKVTIGDLFRQGEK